MIASAARSFAERPGSDARSSRSATRGVSGFRSSCESNTEEKYFVGHGCLGQGLLELELLFDLAALREVGKRQIEIFLIFLAVADDTLDADKGLLASGVPE
jgi:hypothetical protein